jgi:cyclase
VPRGDPGLSLSAAARGWTATHWGKLHPSPPFVTFEDQLKLWIDDLRVELHYIGTPAHTTNDIVAWVPDRSVLFTGDLVFVGGTPFVPMGSVSGSLVALERIRGFGTKTLVPGHGPVSGPEAIDVVADYLRFIQETAVPARPPDCRLWTLRGKRSSVDSPN